MKALNLLMALSAATFSLMACNPGANSSTPVTTPNSNIYSYQGPGSNSSCLQQQGFHDRDDMCRQLRDGRMNVCSNQERYMLFQNACANLRWQDRDGDEQIPGRHNPEIPIPRRSFNRID